jgi:putative restriction endonuclease
VAVTDKDWYRFLSGRPNLDEVNFWQPGGSREFRTLSPGEPFLFKLHYHPAGALLLRRGGLAPDAGGLLPF